MVIISPFVISFFEFFIFRDIAGITIFPFIFIKDKKFMTKEIINHEKIHIRQQIEMLIIPFYLCYAIEGIFKGYYNISFEREAYSNQNDLNYLKTRRMFSFLKYFKKQ